jgi:hypothetical protein
MRDQPVTVDTRGQVAMGHEDRAAEHLLLTDPGDLLKTVTDTPG